MCCVVQVAKADEGDSCTVKLTGRAAGVIRSDVHDGDILGRGPCSRAEPGAHKTLNHLKETPLPREVFPSCQADQCIGHAARLSERKLLARVQHDSLKEIAVPSEPHKAKVRKICLTDTHDGRMGSPSARVSRSTRLLSCADLGWHCTGGLLRHCNGDGVQQR